MVQSFIDVLWITQRVASQRFLGDDIERYPLNPAGRANETLLDHFLGLNIRIVIAITVLQSFPRRLLELIILFAVL